MMSATISWITASESVTRTVAVGAIDPHVVAQWKRREQDLLAIRKYRANWDGFDSDAPDPELIDAALAFLLILRNRNEADPPMRVALSPNGEVAIEWQCGDNFRRAELAQPNEVEWMTVIAGGDAEFETESLRAHKRSLRAHKRIETREDVWEPNEIGAGAVVSA